MGLVGIAPFERLGKTDDSFAMIHLAGSPMALAVKSQQALECVERFNGTSSQGLCRVPGAREIQP